MLMPSSEGLEVDVALSKGFRQDRMVIVDRNVAIVASLKGRKFPLVTAKGGAIKTMGAKIISAGLPKLHIVNCDFTGTVGTSSDELAEFCGSGVLAPAAMVGVTVVKGRERPQVFEQVKQAANDTRGSMPRMKNGADAVRALGGGSNFTDEIVDGFDRETVGGRLAMLCSAISGPSERKTGHWAMDEFFTPRRAMLSKYGQYRSGTQMMLWAVFKVHEHPCLCDVCLANVLRYTKPEKAQTFLDLYFRALGLRSNESRHALMSVRSQNIGYSRVL